MNGVLDVGFDGAEFIDRLTDHIHHAAKCRLANRNADRTAEVLDLHPTNHSICRQHRDSAHTSFAEVLLNLCDGVHFRVDIETFGCDSERLINRRQIVV